MPADLPEGPTSVVADAQRTRLWLTAAGAFAFVCIECVVLIWLMREINLRLPLSIHVLVTMRRLLPPLAAGFVVHALFRVWRRRDASYLRTIARPGSIGLFLTLFGSLVLLMVFYGSLKVMVPLLNERSFDELFWRIDSVLLFGLSPNVFFVNLLDNSLLLRFIDWGYGYFFFFAVFISIPLFLPHDDDRLRVSFVTANVLLWSAGAWLYLAFPSLGPAYRFMEVWDGVREQFPVSMYWQKQLIENYQIVLRIPGGSIDPQFSMFEGIGAFPSLHVGFQTLFALYLGRISTMLGRVAWLLVGLTFLGSILTGWHYMVDSIAGLGLAIVIFLLLERFLLPVASHDSQEAPS